MAATEESVDLFLEPASVTSSQFVMIENRSTEEIVVNGVQLRSCRNIRNECRTAPMQVVVRPRETKRLLEVRTDNDNQASEFSYSVSWVVAPVSIPIIP